MKRVRVLKKLSLLILICVIATSLLAPFTVSAQLPFGGMITSIQPCNTGWLIFLSPPVGGFYMYVPGSYSYLYGPPTHPGQWLLGMATAPPVPCIVGLFPIGAGLPIIFHGSSL